MKITESSGKIQRKKKGKQVVSFHRRVEIKKRIENF